MFGTGRIRIRFPVSVCSIATSYPACAFARRDRRCSHRRRVPRFLSITSSPCSTTTLFSVVRGNDGSTIGITGGIKPLLIASVPAIGYAAYTRAMPPQALIFGVYSAGLLHLYDRVWHPKGMMLEHMPIAHVNRRVL